MKKTTILYVMAVLCLKKRKANRPKLKAKLILLLCLGMISTAVLAQNSSLPSGEGWGGALKVGDKLPESFWQQEHTIYQNGKTTKQNLSAYKGKLLILDFWNSSCIPCIEAFPKLDSLQAKYGAQLQIIPITKQSFSHVNNFIRSNAYTNKTALNIMIGDSYFAGLFPHLALPHLVWISQDGLFLNTTSGEYINELNIHSILNGMSAKLTSKTDRLNFNTKVKLFKVQHNANSVAVNFYTIIGGHLPGLPTMAGVNVDSTNHVKRYYGINHSILQLYAIALNSNLPLLTNRRQIEVADASQFIYQKENGYLTEWMGMHTYTYEKLMPMATDQEGFNKALLQDLNTNFNLDGSIEQRLVEGMEIITVAQSKLMQSRYFKQELHLKEVVGKSYLRKISLNDLARILNMQPNMPMVWNQSNYAGFFDIEFKKLPTNIDQWQLVLGNLGLALTPLAKTQATFVLNDRTKQHNK